MGEKYWTKFVLLAAGIVGLAMVGFGTSLFNAPVFADAATQPSTPADVTVSADDIKKDFAKDPKAAAAKYVGKSIQVAGNVSGVAEYNGDHKYIFTLNDSPHIRCTAAPAGRKDAKALSRKQDATIRGTCSAVTGDEMTLSDCWVVTSGADPAMKASAADLAKAYATNTDIDNYEGNQLALDGVVVEVNTDHDYLTLEGFTDAAGKAVVVKCMLGVPGIEDAAKLTKGSHVLVKGACYGFESDHSMVTVMQAVLQN